MPLTYVIMRSSGGKMRKLKTRAELLAYIDECLRQIGEVRKLNRLKTLEEKSNSTSINMDLDEEMELRTLREKFLGKNAPNMNNNAYLAIENEFPDSVLYAYYRKYVQVKAEQAGKERVGQQLSTIMSNGHVEVKDAVIQDPTDWIVTNPKGEAYIVKDAKFKMTYELNVGADGKHAPIGEPNAFLMVPEDIEFMVPWGEGGSLIPFKLKKGGYLNVTDAIDVTNVYKKHIGELDIYGVQRDEFKETYAQCSAITGEFYDPKLREAFGQEQIFNL